MNTTDRPIRIAVLGAGGLGKAAARIIGMKRQVQLCAICDSKGVVLSPEGIDIEPIAGLGGDLVDGFRQWQEERSIQAPQYAAQSHENHTTPLPQSQVTMASGVMATAQHCEDPIGAIIEAADNWDGVLIALPNMPNDFIPGVVKRFMDAGTSLAFADVLKRTTAVDLMFGLDQAVQRARSVVLTGCGATPGLLSAAAVLAAQSFVEVEHVKIWWGVGIANWDAYKATIREDIAHLDGYSVKRAQGMSDAEVEQLLDETGGLLELRHMEHADDILLQRVGVVDDQAQVEVGGVMDTRHAKKPVSTAMTLTGITHEGKRSSHTFILGDETTMAANVIGPALGYLKRALWLKQRNLFGVFGSTEFLPLVVR